MSAARLSIAALGLVLLASASRPLAAAPPAEPSPPTVDAGAFLAQTAPSIVNVRAVVNVRMSGGGQSRTRDTAVEGQGTIVDPSGLVLVGHDVVTGDLGGFFDLLKQFGVESTPSLTSLHVTVNGEGAEREAVLVARDATLGVAFIHLLGEEGKPWRHVDLANGAAPVLGRRLLAVARKSRGFDHVPLLLRLYASRRIEQPRRAFGVEGDYQAAGIAHLTGDLFGGGMHFAGGTPAFDQSGRPVGIFGSQASVPTGDDADAEVSPVLLPLDVVRRSLEAAKKRVPEALEKARAAK